MYLFCKHSDAVANMQLLRQKLFALPLKQLTMLDSDSSEVM